MTTDELKLNHDPLLAHFASAAQEASAASESTVRKDFPCDDGILVVTSHAGGEVEYAVEPYPVVLRDDEETDNRAQAQADYAEELSAFEAAQAS